MATFAMPTKEELFAHLSEKGHPISREDFAGGSVMYCGEREAPGYFAFTYYNRKRMYESKTELYVQGLYEYIRLVTLPGTPYEGWKVIIYTDADTFCRTFEYVIKTHSGKNVDSKKILYKILGKGNVEEDGKPIWLSLHELRVTDPDYAEDTEVELRKIFSLVYPNIIIGIVDWPEYTIKEGQIDDPILRMMRQRALVDFNGRPCFIRDADTIFEGGMVYQNYSKKNATEIHYVEQFEINFYRNFFASSAEFPFCIGTEKGYSKGWHMNRLHQKCGQFNGVYAGFLSYAGTLARGEMESYWNACLEFLRGRVSIQPLRPGLFKNANSKSTLKVRLKYGYSIPENIVNKILNEGAEPNIEYRVTDNLESDIFIGKDEQLLIFLFIPTFFDRIYFYDLPLQKTTKEFSMFDADLSDKVYADRGKHEALKALFAEQTERYRKCLEENAIGGKRRGRRYTKKRKHYLR